MTNAAKRYAQSEKGKLVRKKIRSTSKYKKMQAEWRAKGGSKAEYMRNKDNYINRDMKKRYGIGLNEYYCMLKEQNECCYICGTHETNNGSRLAIDHDHISGKIRKLLCRQCNTALGNVKENVEVLKKMINYIEEHITQCV